MDLFIEVTFEHRRIEHYNVKWPKFTHFKSWLSYLYCSAFIPDSKPIQPHPNPSKAIRTQPNPIKPIKNLIKTHQNPSKPIKSHQNQPNPTKPIKNLIKTHQNPLEPIKNPFKPNKTNLKLIKTHQNSSKPIQTKQNPLKTHQNPSKPIQNLTNGFLLQIIVSHGNPFGRFQKLHQLWEVFRRMSIGRWRAGFTGRACQKFLTKHRHFLFKGLTNEIRTAEWPEC